MKSRNRMVRIVSARRERVRSGAVETVYSTVVGDGRLVRKRGAVVSIAAVVR